MSSKKALTTSARLDAANAIVRALLDYESTILSELAYNLFVIELHKAQAKRDAAFARFMALFNK